MRGWAHRRTFGTGTARTAPTWQTSTRVSSAGGGRSRPPGGCPQDLAEIGLACDPDRGW